MKKDLKTSTGGFTLIELMIGIAIVGILASIATPNYLRFRDRARDEMALTGIRLIDKEIANYVAQYGELPEDLSVIGMDEVLDPWGRPYEYLVTEGVCDEKDKGKDKTGEIEKIDDNRETESYLAGLRWMSMGTNFLFPGFNIAFIQLVEFNKIFPQDILLSLLAKKDKEDKPPKDKEDKDKDDKSKSEKARKDHSLHPINCDYDLYSKGKDGKTTAPLTAKISQDDIIRANNGGYFGLASDY